MAAVDPVGRDPEAIANDSAQPLSRKEPVVATEDEPRRYVGPRRERPRLSAGGIRLTAASRNGLLGKAVGDVVVEDRPCARVVARLGLPAGDAKHLLGGFTGQRDHGGDQDDQPRLRPFSDNRCDVAAERLGHDDDIMPITDRVHDDICVSRQPRGVVLDGEVGRDRVVTTSA